MLPKFRIVKYRGYYYAAWREDGAPRRRALRTKDRRIAEQTLKSFAEQYEIANRPEVVDVAFCWNGYMEALGGKPAAITMGFEARAILPFFGTIPAGDIKEVDCRDYCIRRKAAGRRDGTIWTELGRLRSALKWAERKKLIVKAPSIYRPSLPAARDLRLSRQEAQSFLSACSMPHIRLFVILAITTGARMSALLGLTWDRVNFEGKIIDLYDPTRPRTHKGRPVVPMNRTAAAALSEARTGALTPYVIEWAGHPVKQVRHALASVGRRCGLPWVTAHVFRHTAACLMAEAGIPIYEIAQFLGHSSSKITERVYSRLSPTYLQKAAEALEICEPYLRVQTISQRKKDI